MVPVGSALKRAVDYVLCALCYVQPAYFAQLLTWSGVRCEALTDDNKEALQGPSAPDLLLAIDESRLLTLGVACQSPECVNRLLDSGFPAVLCQALFEFCTRPTRVASGLEEFGTATEYSDKPDDSKAAESAAAGRPASKLYCI